MPNRILKESICTSESIDSLTEFQEVFFYRLIVSCDDFGRMDGRAKILSSRLFPLRPVPTDKVASTISALVDADLIQTYTVEGKPYIQLKSWRKHQQVRASKSKYPSPEDCDSESSEDTCNQLISDDSKCPRNRIRNTIYDNRESVSVSEPLIADDDARAIQQEHMRVLDAADDAGFAKGNTVRARLLALYAEHGLDKMLNGISECVRHGVTNLAYLEAVLKGGDKKSKHEKARVVAQDFAQRDYSDVNDDMMSELAQEIASMKGDAS